MQVMLTQLHDALMVPQPGHEHSLLKRMVAVTIAAETGKATGDSVIRWAKVVSAIGAIIGGLYASINWGHAPK